MCVNRILPQVSALAGERSASGGHSAGSVRWQQQNAAVGELDALFERTAPTRLRFIRCLTLRQADEPRNGASASGGPDASSKKAAFPERLLLAQLEDQGLLAAMRSAR